MERIPLSEKTRAFFKEAFMFFVFSLLIFLGSRFNSINFTPENNSSSVQALKISDFQICSTGYDRESNPVGVLIEEKELENENVKQSEKVNKKISFHGDQFISFSARIKEKIFEMSKTVNSDSPIYIKVCSLKIPS